MGIRYRKSINLGGGARMNLSKSGVGFSVGTKGARLTKTAKGTTRSTLSIPGSGISYVSETGKSGKRQKNTEGSRDRLETSGMCDLLDAQDQSGIVCPQGETKNIFCVHCGQKLFVGARFCSSCGRQVGQEKTAKKTAIPMGLAYIVGRVYNYGPTFVCFGGEGFWRDLYGGCIAVFALVQKAEIG